MSSTTPPWTGTDAPQTPLRPAAAVTGTRASWHRARTADDLARPTTAGRPRRRQPRHLALRGPRHGAGPPVAAGLGQRRGVGRDRRAGLGEALDQVVGDLRPRRGQPGGGGRGPAGQRDRRRGGARPQGRQRLRGGHGPTVEDVRPGRGTRGGRLRRALVGEGGAQGGGLGRLAVGVPAQLGAHQGRHIGGRGGRGLGAEEHGPGAPGQHVAQVGGHLVAGRVHGLGPLVGEARHQRLAQRRVGLDHRPHHPGLAAVAVGQAHVDRGLGVVALGAPQAQLARAAAPNVPAPAHHGVARLGQHLERGVDGVGRHLPVGGELAAGDGDQAALGRATRGAGGTGRPSARWWPP